MLKLIKQSLLFGSFFLYLHAAIAADKTSLNSPPSTRESFEHFINDIKERALAEGISEQLLDRIFNELTLDNKVIRLERTQPEKRLTFLEYRHTRIDPLRIALGVREYNKHRSLLENVGQSIGADPCFITAFWGIETSYGKFMGNFSVIRSLTTLAYQSNRSEQFRKELFIGLHILNDGHITMSKFKGEWAGASGIPQFLPSSWQLYAVDYDRDGKKDIWTSQSDAFASIANYLVKHGWQMGQPWGVMVSLPPNFPDDLTGLTQKKSVKAWLAMGIKPVYSAVVPNLNEEASIIHFEGGPDYMVFNNFRVLLSYNNSNYYAAAVGYLADEICKKVREDEVTNF